MKQAQRISATQARNNFFNLLNQSFLEKQSFIVEKSKIPMVCIVPVTTELLDSELSNNSYAEKLLRLDGDWFSLKDWKEVRKRVEKRITNYAA